MNSNNFLAGNIESTEEDDINEFCNSLLRAKIAEHLEDILLVPAIVDGLRLPETKSNDLKELCELAARLDMCCRLVFFSNREERYVHSIRLDAPEGARNKEQELNSPIWDLDEVGGAVKMLRFLLDNKNIVNKINGDAARIDDKINELSLRARKLLGGRVYTMPILVKGSRTHCYIYDRSAKHLYGKQVFTIKNVFDPNNNQAYTRQWKFRLNELGILEKFIEHDEKILRELRTRHSDN